MDLPIVPGDFTGEEKQEMRRRMAQDDATRSPLAQRDRGDKKEPKVPKTDPDAPWDNSGNPVLLRMPTGEVQGFDRDELRANAERVNVDPDAHGGGTGGRGPFYVAGGLAGLLLLMTLILLLNNRPDAQTEASGPVETVVEEAPPVSDDPAEEPVEEAPAAPAQSESEGVSEEAQSDDVVEESECSEESDCGAESDELLLDLPPCPDEFQQDTTGTLKSGVEGEVAERPSFGDIELAANLTCSAFSFGSYVFTVIVEGDGEILAISENVNYDLRFIVNNQWPDNVYDDDTGFEVLIAWNRLAGVFVGTVNSASRTRIDDAVVDIVWLDPSTVQVTVDLPGDDVEVNRVRVELFILTLDDDGNSTGFFEDIAMWHAEQ